MGTAIEKGGADVEGSAVGAGGADVEGSTVEAGGSEVGGIVDSGVDVGSCPWLLAVAMGFVPSGQEFGGNT